MKSIFARTVSLLAAVIVASATAYSNVEVLHAHNYGDGKSLTYMIFRDEATGKRWLVQGLEDGTSLFALLNTDSASPAGIISVAPNFSVQCAESQSITAPGADLGVIITDTNHQSFEFRNCLNEQERAEGKAAWERELKNDPTLSLLYRPHGLGNYAQEVILSSFKKHATQEDLLGSKLASDYVKSRYNTSDPNFIDALSKDKAFGYIIKNNTDIAIEVPPTAQNNYQLTVRSVDPNVEVATEVLNSSGQTVWKNSVGAATPVDMSQCSSGTYFVKGGGQPIPVMLAR